MDYTGTVEKIEDETALVKIDAIDGEEKTIFVDNAKGAAVGSRVEVQMPVVMTDGVSVIVYMIPLAGVILGALSGRFLGGDGPLGVLIKKIAGPAVGGVISGGDNLALTFGLVGLSVSIIFLSVWIKKRKQKFEEMAKIVEIIAD